MHSAAVGLALLCVCLLSNIDTATASIHFPPDYITVARPVSRSPHDESSYTEGLCVSRGLLFEGTGLSGASFLTATPLESALCPRTSSSGASAARNRLLARRFPSRPTPVAGDTYRMPPPDSTAFGEGVAAARGLLFQVTLHGGEIIVYNAFELARAGAEAATAADARRHPGGPSLSYGAPEWSWCTVPLPPLPPADVRFPRPRQWWGLAAYDAADAATTHDALSGLSAAHSGSGSGSGVGASAQQGFARARAAGPPDEGAFDLWLSDGSPELHLLRLHVGDEAAARADAEDGGERGGGGAGTACGWAEWLHPVTGESAGGVAPRGLRVTTPAGAPVAGLNELELVDVRTGGDDDLGVHVQEIWANVLQSDCIARISPDTGVVKGWVYLGPLDDGPHRSVRSANGIAALHLPPSTFAPHASQGADTPGHGLDSGSGAAPLFPHVLLTGKLWPWLYRAAIDPLASLFTGGGARELPAPASTPDRYSSNSSGSSSSGSGAPDGFQRFAARHRDEQRHALLSSAGLTASASQYTSGPQHGFSGRHGMLRRMWAEHRRPAPFTTHTDPRTWAGTGADTEAADAGSRAGSAAAAAPPLSALVQPRTGIPHVCRATEANGLAPTPEDLRYQDGLVAAAAARLGGGQWGG